MIRNFKDITVSDFITTDKVDGVDIINLYTSNSNLAKKLSPYVPLHRGIKLVDITIFNLNKFMTYLSKVGYDINHCIRKRAPKSEYVRLETRQVKNYWGIIIYLLILKIKNDKSAIELLKENTLPFNVYKDTEKVKVLLGKEYKTKDKVAKLHGYCKACEFLQDMVKSGVNLNNETEVTRILDEQFPGIADSIEAVYKDMIVDIEKSNKVTEPTKPGRGFTQSMTTIDGLGMTEDKQVYDITEDDAVAEVSEGGSAIPSEVAEDTIPTEEVVTETIEEK